MPVQNHGQVDQPSFTLFVPMPVTYQSARDTAHAAVAELRRSGYTLSELQAHDLVNRIEQEILRALTAQAAANALSRQLKISFGPAQKLLKEAVGVAPRIEFNVAGP